MSAILKPRRRGGSRERNSANDQGAATPTRDLAHVLILERDRYRVRIIARERDGSRFVACVGELLTPQGTWIPARAFNFRKSEIDTLIDGLERAREILA
ncbi:MAG TPA: hypothetical protein VGM13_08705 [Thermoanaerobaculia bacterium]|jgi:hypothetical protein